MAINCRLYLCEFDRFISHCELKDIGRSAHDMDDQTQRYIEKIKRKANVIMNCRFAVTFLVLLLIECSLCWYLILVAGVFSLL